MTSFKIIPALAKLGVYPHHGIDIPLFSLKSKKSSGIGEFLDLYYLIDWCSELTLDILQLLPLNDTGTMTSPYSILSSCALNPIYLSLHDLPQENPIETTLFKPFNETESLNYEAVLTLKMQWLKTYFLKYALRFLTSESYLNFVKEETWVFNYALFKTLHSHYQYLPWFKWPEAYRKPDLTLATQHQEEISFHIFLQYLCYEQMKKVKKYAELKKVFLFGDLPILIHPESADVWEDPDLFDRTLEAGAPPDFYVKDGQNWGFPILRYDLHPDKALEWWQRRLKTASKIYDLYRIDHAVGLYRIYTIPKGKKTKEGEFLPKNPQKWIDQGEKILQYCLSCCPLFPIAEDLGTVPEEVKQSLTQLGIPGTKVMRWENTSSQHQYTSVQSYPPLSLTCVSTHDSPTLEQWWRDFPEEASLYAKSRGWSYHPHLSKEKHQQILWESHHTPSLFHVNLLSEYLALVPELRGDPAKERINIPGVVLPINWSYRLRPYLEDLIVNDSLKGHMREIIS